MDAVSMWTRTARICQWVNAINAVEIGTDHAPEAECQLCEQQLHKQQKIEWAQHVKLRYAMSVVKSCS
jgi:hypothetical protein